MHFKMVIHQTSHLIICDIFNFSLGEKGVVHLLLENGAEPIKQYSISNRVTKINGTEESLLNGGIARKGMQTIFQNLTLNPVKLQIKRVFYFEFSMQSVQRSVTT